MRAEIKSLSAVMTDDLEHFSPEDPDVFSVPMTLTVGTPDSPGGDNFEFQVCSPRYLASEVRDGGVLLVRHRLLMNAFDIQKVRQFVERYVRGCEANTWEELANKLSRLGTWEFEDYQEYKEGQ
ncbi:Immunity protein 8 [Stigmatella aurantiaca]|uniref:Immunity protein 8 n=1 Tax=Stigmatella aurantiaca TaxID=41 RepID=A0A1H7RV83_STIAU|nr:immunity 8 family protein [Stigmatella aurantiaca]SEL64190.1 Immunity protein 8 [Stigmatella aurantiaca]